MNPNRMSCGEAREKLPLYVGGDLDPEVLESVRAHLDACGECAPQAAEALRARRELVGALRAREVGPVRPALWPGIRAALRAEGLVHEPRAVPLSAPVAAGGARRPRWTWALVPVAAAAVLVVLVQLGSVLVPKGGAERRNDLVDVPSAEAPPVAEVTPVAQPPAGGLQRVDPREGFLRPQRYMHPAGRSFGTTSVPQDISLTGLNGFK